MFSEESQTADIMGQEETNNTGKCAAVETSVGSNSPPHVYWDDDISMKEYGDSANDSLKDENNNTYEDEKNAQKFVDETEAGMIDSVSDSKLEQEVDDNDRKSDNQHNNRYSDTNRYRENPRQRDHYENKSTSILIDNLDSDIFTQDIREHFESLGEIRDIYIPLHYETREPRGFAFVEFLKRESAEAAVKEMDGTTIKDCKIYVHIARHSRKTPDDMRSRRGGYNNRGDDRNGNGRRSNYYNSGFKRQDNGYSRDRGERSRDRIDRSDRSDRSERPERSERPDRGERSGRGRDRNYNRDRSRDFRSRSQPYNSRENNYKGSRYNRYNDGDDDNSKDE